MRWFSNFFKKSRNSRSKKMTSQLKQDKSNYTDKYIDKQVEMWQQMGFTVHGVKSAKEDARKVADARPNDAWFDEAVNNMVSIYRKYPQGFVQGQGGAPEQELRQIGEMLNKKGGKDLMRAAHAEFARMCEIYGAKRNLEFIWDGIGGWQG